MRVIHGLALAAIVSLAVASAHAQTTKPITLATAEAIRAWVEAVKSHTPGRADAAVVAVAGYPYEARVELNHGMSLFLTALMGREYDTRKNRAAESIAFMGHAVGKSFLKRAAVFHADVAAYSERFPGKQTTAARRRPLPDEELHSGGGLSGAMRLDRKDSVPPLLMEDRLLLTRDGQVTGEVLSTWNWPFARSLLDLLNTKGVEERARDPFVSAWYHATTAYMFASGLYGDATSHLYHASRILPDDAVVVFDRGCYAEALGLPMHQALLPDSPIAARDPALRIPPPDRTNADAERLFRRALELDPSHPEARVRLARLLIVRDKDREATIELNRALQNRPTPVVSFYARLFAGRAAQAQGAMREAMGHYQAARDLFPNAQSALLSLSLLALLDSDMPAALAPVERLGAASSVYTADPWWQYHLCSGRDADDLLTAVWDMLPPAS